MNTFVRATLSASLTALCGFAVMTSLVGCTDVGGYPNGPSYGPPPPPPYGYVGEPYYGHDYNHHDWDRQNPDRHDWDHRDQSPPPVRVQAPPPRHEELHCPSGTHPSTHRCTNDERRRGCKDYGAGNGQGCSNF